MNAAAGSTSFIVVGDLGGTNCRLELIPRRSKTGDVDENLITAQRPDAWHRAKYKSSSASSLVQLLKRFVGEPECVAALKVGGPVDLFSIAVCGPVTNGRAILLASSFGKDGWNLDAKDMSLELGAKVTLLNDFHAVGLSLPHIPASDIHVVHSAGGNRDPNGVMACLGPGTGLGQVYVVPQSLGNIKEVGSRSNFIVCCSEGGMSDFVARTKDEWDLRNYIASITDSDFVEVEKVVSGEGIFYAYRWMREAHPELVVDVALDNRILSADEPAGLIALHGTPGQSNADQLCIASINLFLDTLGAEAGNLAIRYQAKGGVFIAGGGIARKLLTRILDGRVAAAFVAKGHSIKCYENVPLYVASTPGDELGLLGAWQWALLNVW